MRPSRERQDTEPSLTVGPRLLKCLKEKGVPCEYASERTGAGCPPAPRTLSAHWTHSDSLRGPLCPFYQMRRLSNSKERSLTHQRHSEVATNEESGHSHPRASPACLGGHCLNRVCHHHLKHRCKRGTLHTRVRAYTHVHKTALRNAQDIRQQGTT